MAAYAIHFNLSVVHNDIDFDRIATNLSTQEGVLRIWSE
ncbi:PIN domain nuclease [Larkinella humicola]|uniref:PIN domain nuclease n=1 Tax=Larkinella humicola TaxID=2607654 RepID=A0A5N1JSU1_9BACT|nr:PIN domain nuclease [Larkinella humicola]